MIRGFVSVDTVAALASTVFNVIFDKSSLGFWQITMLTQHNYDRMIHCFFIIKGVGHVVLWLPFTTVFNVIFGKSSLSF